MITVFGLPALVAFMSGCLSRRRAGIAILAVIVVMVAAYALGTQHPHMLSCQDFSISGNFAPENCNPGMGSTSG